MSMACAKEERSAPGRMLHRMPKEERSADARLTGSVSKGGGHVRLVVLPAGLRLTLRPWSTVVEARRPSAASRSAAAQQQEHAA